MVLDLMARPGRSVALAELGVTPAQLRAADSMAAIKVGQVKRVFWLEDRAYAVVCRHEWLPHTCSAMPEGALTFRLQRLADPREWRRPSSPWGIAWCARVKDGDYAGLEVGDPQGRDWVFGADWFKVAIVESSASPVAPRRTIEAPAVSSVASLPDAPALQP